MTGLLIACICASFAVGFGAGAAWVKLGPRLLMVLVALLQLAAFALAGSPADAVGAALADLANVDPVRHRQTRYLSFGHVAMLTDPAETITAVNYTLNAVSRGRVIYRVEPVAGDLLRLELAAYADLKDEKSFQQLWLAWENLASADPYYHLRTQVVVPAAGKVPAKTKTVFTDGGWVGIERAGELLAACHSTGAVLRADWFVANALHAHYYDLAGVAPKQADFLKSLGVDLVEINRLAAESAANLFRSDVTGKPRRIVFRPSPQGGVWITLDVAAESPDKDPFRNPINYKGQKYAFDANEVFFSRANGFFGFALYDAAGNRLNAVDPKIATDTTAPAGHGELVPAISCIRCHSAQQDAMQPFTDEQTALPPVLALDPAVKATIDGLYDPRRLDRELVRAREDYSDAVMAATGQTSAAAAAAVSSVYAAHVFDMVTATTATDELGCEPDLFAGAMAGTADPVLIRLATGGKVNRKAWEGSFPEAALRTAAIGGVETKGVEIKAQTVPVPLAPATRKPAAEKAKKMARS